VVASANLDDDIQDGLWGDTRFVVWGSLLPLVKPLGPDSVQARSSRGWSTRYSTLGLESGRPGSPP
jgi:hypothetical protein